ncbi:hypothetical protein [Pseudomonas sp. Ant30-3]|uniref:hypothetical protein n=1 Tax=Pseudomonas sp. Ant30-3 TaxID=1488328 RepID=UPI00048F18AA|nr:hypothetical protein [Pseudomonas sp. Ant30-3]
MLRFSLFGLIVLCTSCSLNHGKPIATLTYSDIAELEGTGIYQVRFTSDVEILELFKSHIGQGLICSVGKDLDFSVAHQIKRSGYGFVERIEDASEKKYQARVIFRESTGEKGAEIFPEGEALKHWIASDKYISCIFRSHSTTYKTYFSNVMRVPTGDLVRAIER